MSEIKTIHVENETPTGTVDGANKDFVIANLPDPTASLEVIVGGITLILDTDYTIDDYTISFIEAPAPDSVIRTNYRHVDASVLTITIAQIIDAGILAALDKVDFTAHVEGTEKPEDNATKNEGALADKDNVDFNTEVVGTEKPEDNATKNEGALADKNDVDFNTEVVGAEKPEDNATKNDGDLADLNTVDSEQIDDGAVILEKLTANKRVIMSAFESLDGWSISGLTIQDMANVKVYTTATLNNLSSFYAVPSNWIGLDWTKDFFWQSAVKINQITNQEIQFGMGATDDIGAFSAAGFKITDGTLYAFHAEDPAGSTLVYTTEVIAGITLTDWNVYRMVYDQSAGTLKFYINGILVHTFSSSLPTENDGAVTSYQIKTTETAVKQMYTSDLLISVPR